MKKITSMIALAGVAALATSAFGQTGSGGTISDGNAFFTLGNFATTAGGLATSILNGNTADVRLAGAAGPDQAFGSSWWYRVNGVDTRERLLTSATAPLPAWSGNNGSRNFSLASGSGLTASTSYVISDPDGAGGSATFTLLMTMTINNPGSTAVSMSIFNYFDPFIGAEDAGDTVSLFAPNVMRFSDQPADPVLFYAGFGASALQASAWTSSTATDLGRLADASITNLTNVVGPAGGGDKAAAYQWNIEIPAGGSFSVTAALSTDSTIPAPGAVALAGIAGLAGIRRRR